MPRIIMGIQVASRENDAVQVQKLLTEKGCIIKSRIGLHDTSEKSCSPSGLILLEFADGVEEEIKNLETELIKIDSVVIKKMEF